VGLKEVAEHKGLQALNLYGVKVTDAGLKVLAGLKALQTLDLGYTRVTDVGLKEVACPARTHLRRHGGDEN
jgi:hypothetical protein